MGEDGCGAGDVAGRSWDRDQGWLGMVLSVRRAAWA